MSIFQSDWQSLPIWKIVILVAVCLASPAVLLLKLPFSSGRWPRKLLASIGLLSVLVIILLFVPTAGLIPAAVAVGDPGTSVFDINDGPRRLLVAPAGRPGE